MVKSLNVKTFQIGKKGLTDAFIKQIQTTFKNSNKVKISILKSACRDREEAKLIAEKLVTSLGENFDYKLIGYTITIMKFRK